MPKIPACDRCLLYVRDPHLICAVHPFGVKAESCPDGHLDPDAAAQLL